MYVYSCTRSPTCSIGRTHNRSRKYLSTVLYARVLKSKLKKTTGTRCTEVLSYKVQRCTFVLSYFRSSAWAEFGSFSGETDRLSLEAPVYRAAKRSYRPPSTIGKSSVSTAVHQTSNHGGLRTPQECLRTTHRVSSTPWAPSLRFLTLQPELRNQTATATGGSPPFLRKRSPYPECSKRCAAAQLVYFIFSVNK